MLDELSGRGSGKPVAPVASAGRRKGQLFPAIFDAGATTVVV